MSQSLVSYHLRALRDAGLAQHELRLHARPGVEWPRRALGRFGRMGAFLAHRLFGQAARYVATEADVRILVSGQAAIARGLLPHRRRVAGVLPPVTGSWAGGGA
jgi:Bacterial regulatory protein, arsR family